MWILLVLIGYLSGIISGMGIGGGAVLIPALSFFFAAGQREAQQMNLLYFIPTAIIALFAHNNRGNIEKDGLFRLTAFGLFGAAAGSFLALWVDAGLLRRGFGVFLLAVGLMELKKGLKARERAA